MPLQENTPDPLTHHELLNSSEFKALIQKRWLVSGILLLALFVIYYGFILLIAYQKSIVVIKLGAVTPLGIPLGVMVIVLSWLLTAIYVYWANRYYDPKVRAFVEQLQLNNEQDDTV